MLLMKWQTSKIFQAFLQFLIHDYSNFNHCSIDFILDWFIHPKNDDTQIDWMLCVLSRLLEVKALVASMRRSGWSCLSGSGEIRLYPELCKKVDQRVRCSVSFMLNMFDCCYLFYEFCVTPWRRRQFSFRARRLLIWMRVHLERMQLKRPAPQSRGKTWTLHRKMSYKRDTTCFFWTRKFRVIEFIWHHDFVGVQCPLFRSPPIRAVTKTPVDCKLS